MVDRVLSVREGDEVLRLYPLRVGTAGVVIDVAVDRAHERTLRRCRAGARGWAGRGRWRGAARDYLK